MLIIINIDYLKCNFCTLCYLICPKGVFVLDGNRKVRVGNVNLCSRCYSCVINCSKRAISLEIKI